MLIIITTLRDFPFEAGCFCFYSTGSYAMCFTVPFNSGKGLAPFKLPWTTGLGFFASGAEFGLGSAEALCGLFLIISSLPHWELIYLSRQRIEQNSDSDM